MNIAIYDNGGRTFDRYTVVYLDEPAQELGTYTCRGMSENPTHPQGFGQCGVARPGEHLGDEITFDELPAGGQRVVRQDLGLAT